jgi:hypothetical protein
LPDETPVVEIDAINGVAWSLTRGHFKAAHFAFETALETPPAPEVCVTQEDANNYCRILSLLGMEEEGDPVAEVERLLSAPPAPEVEPVAWLIEIPDGDWKEIKLCRHNAIGDYREAYPGATSTPLYTHPANDGLRKAAGEIIKIWDEEFDDFTFERAVENLRAELNKDKS